MHNRKPCRWGDQCQYHQQQRCHFYHPPQSHASHQSNQVDAFSDYPSAPKIIAKPYKYKTTDEQLINQGITTIRHVYSFGMIGYKLDAVSNQYLFLAIQHKHNREWGFPKGHYEANKESNTGYDTAKREFVEETGIEINHQNIISIEWDNPFILNYQFTRNHILCKKWTVLFVARLSDYAKPNITHPHEINDIRFLNMQQFINKTEHQLTKDVLRTFHQRLTAKKIDKRIHEHKQNVQDTDKMNDKVLIVLRGFPGSGKSTLTKAIIKYYGSSNCVSCSFDKYHWSGKEEGKGVFEFNYNIHRHTKKWCKQEIFESMKRQIKCIVVDNGHFEVWEYSNYVEWCSKFGYKMLVIEIKSETKSMKRQEHIEHMNKNLCCEECLLCVMQRKRCKMEVPNGAMSKFIHKWELDPNAVLLDPKISDDDHWDVNELKGILNQMQFAEKFEYAVDNWTPHK